MVAKPFKFSCANSYRASPDARDSASATRLEACLTNSRSRTASASDAWESLFLSTLDGAMARRISGNWIRYCLNVSASMYQQQIVINVSCLAVGILPVVHIEKCLHFKGACFTNLSQLCDRKLARPFSTALGQHRSWSVRFQCCGFKRSWAE